MKIFFLIQIKNFKSFYKLLQKKELLEYFSIFKLKNKLMQYFFLNVYNLFFLNYKNYILIFRKNYKKLFFYNFLYYLMPNIFSLVLFFKKKIYFIKHLKNFKILTYQNSFLNFYVFLKFKNIINLLKNYNCLSK